MSRRSKDFQYNFRFDGRPWVPAKFMIGFSYDPKEHHNSFSVLRAAGYPSGTPSAASGMHDGTAYIFFNLRNLNRRTLAHEVQHTVFNCMRWMSAPLSEETEEQMCYLNGALTEIISDHIDRKGFRWIKTPRRRR